MLSSSMYMTVLYEANHLFLGHYGCKEVQMNPRRTKSKIHRKSKSCGIHIYWTSLPTSRRIMTPSSSVTPPLRELQISQGKTDQYLIPVPATTHKTSIMYSEFLMVPYLLCFQYSTRDKTDELGPHKRLPFQIHCF